MQSPRTDDNHDRSDDTLTAGPVRRDARCPRGEASLGLAVPYAHPGQGEGHKPADAGRETAASAHSERRAGSLKPCGKNDRKPI